MSNQSSLHNWEPFKEAFPDVVAFRRPSPKRDPLAAILCQVEILFGEKAHLREIPLELWKELAQEAHEAWLHSVESVESFMDEEHEYFIIATNSPEELFMTFAADIDVEDVDFIADSYYATSSVYGREFDGLWYWWST